jgi:hypothetical protein
LCENSEAGNELRDFLLGRGIDVRIDDVDVDRIDQVAVDRIDQDVGDVPLNDAVSFDKYPR